MSNGNGLIVKIPIRDRDGRVIGEKEVVRYQGVLAQAHKEGLKVITTQLIQIPGKDNDQVAIMKAEVQTEKGTFAGVGDASPSNVPARLAPHLIRMAETRAKARALRDAVNIGVVSIEELGELFEENGGGASNKEPANGAHTAPEATPAPADTSASPTNGTPVTEAQRRYLFRILSDQGLEGEAAHDYLKEALGVEQLAKASRGMVSGLIDRMLKQVEATKGKGDRNGAH